MNKNEPQVLSLPCDITTGWTHSVLIDNDPRTVTSAESIFIFQLLCVVAFTFPPLKNKTYFNSQYYSITWLSRFLLIITYLLVHI